MLKITSITLCVFLLVGCNNGEQSANGEAEQAADAAKATVDVQAEMLEDTDKPAVSYSQTKTLEAEVLAIDHETRTVTLADAAGDPVVFIAGDEVRNLDQVKQGDKLAVEYMQSVQFEVVEGEGMQAAEAAVSETVRAGEGEMPGVAAVNNSVQVFEVVDINLEQNTFKLKNVAGTVNEFVARNPENLKKAQVGNFVVVTTQEALAIGVNRLPVE